METHTQTKRNHPGQLNDIFMFLIVFPLTCRYFQESTAVEGIQTLLGQHKGGHLFSSFDSKQDLRQ